MSNAAYLTGLRTRRNAIATELAAITSTRAGGKPNSDGTGVNIDHVGYKDGLYRELKELQQMIKDAEADVSGDAGEVGIIESQEYA